MMKHMAIPLAAAFAVVALEAGPTQAETTLKAVTAWNTRIPSAKECATFYKRVNETVDGVSIRFMGGPEVTPPRQLADAVRRGLFDVGCTSFGYYLGKAPEGDALLATNKSAVQLIKDGDLVSLRKIYAERLGVYVLAVYNQGPGFHIYTTRKPKMRPDGLPDLSGFKIRTSPTHMEFLRKLGATAVSIPFQQVYTALERGVIDGTAFPAYALTQVGLQKFLKYRVDPPILNVTVGVMINLDKWNGLTEPQKASMEKAALAHQEWSQAFFDRLVKKEKEALAKAGVEFIQLDDKAAGAYVDLAHGIAWDRLISREPETGKALKARMYK